MVQKESELAELNKKISLLEREKFRRKELVEDLKVEEVNLKQSIDAINHQIQISNKVNVDQNQEDLEKIKNTLGSQR